MFAERKEKITRLAGLQHQAQQPRLAIEADVKTDMKTRKRAEGAAESKLRHGDTFSPLVDDGPTNLTSFGKIAKPLSASKRYIGDALVNEGAEAPKPYLRPEEVRMLSSATSDMMLAGTASMSMRAIVPHHLFLRTLVKRQKIEPAEQKSTTLPLPVKGTSLKQHQHKLWYLILADGGPRLLRGWVRLRR